MHLGHFILYKALSRTFPHSLFTTISGVGRADILQLGEPRQRGAVTWLKVAQVASARVGTM